MNTQELNQYGLTELSAAEQVEIDGGFLPAIWGIGIAVSAVLYVVDNWGDISAGYEAGKK